MNLNDVPRAPEGAAPAAPTNAAEVARRTLKLMAERRITPTPETFAEAYQEVTGRRTGAQPAHLVKEVLRDLLRSGRMSNQEAGLIQQKLRDNDWRAVNESVAEAFGRRVGAANDNWPQTALNLLRQVDALHANWTRARKLDAVARVIEAAASEPGVALDRIGKLLESWGPAMAVLARSPEPAVVDAPSPPAQPRPAEPASKRYTDSAVEQQLRLARTATETWKQVALRVLRLLEQSCGSDSSAAQKVRDYARQSAQVAAALTDAGAAGASPATSGSEDEVAKLGPRFTDVAVAIERRLDEQNKIKAGLARMLGLLCDNMRALTPDETWLAGQLEPIRALLAGPLTVEQLSDAEHKLATVIERQAHAQRSLQDAKVALKEMLATVIERIGTMGDSTGKFYEQVGSYQRQLEGANDFETLSRVIGGLLTDTQVMRTDLQSSRDELLAARRKVETYEVRVRELERELSQVSTLVQKDPLTYALNRRGLEEAFKMESARASRYGSDLSFLMIDLDDFKRINDSLGHAGGDRALVHLAQMVQSTLRPTDLLVRLGGEEFGVLFPSTSLTDATAASERLLRELARRPFAYEGKQQEISFSGGLAQWRRDERLEQLLERSDSAMYRAKRGGKKRICIAE